MNKETQHIRIGDIIESSQGTFKVTGIVEEQWYEPWIIMAKWNGNAWEESRVQFQDI